MQSWGCLFTLIFALLLSPILAQTPAAPEARRLTIQTFQIEGPELVDRALLMSELGEYQGQSLTLDEMKGLASKLTRLHQKKGYKLAKVFIPKQSFSDGVVRFSVFEGKIGSLKIEGAKHRSPQLLEAYFEDIVADGQYRESDVLRSVLLLNDLPDVKAKARLQPGDKAGTADLVVEVEDRDPIGVWLSYNNYGTPASGDNRAGLTVAATDFTGVGDQLAVSTVLGFPTRSNVYLSADYRRPLNTEGLSFGLSYANSAFSLGEQFEILDVRADADIFSASLSQALARKLDHRSDLTLQVTHSSIRNDLLGIRFSEDEYWKAQLAYRGNWIKPGANTFFQAAVTQGFGQDNRNLASRLGAGGSFTKFSLDLARVQGITPNFRWNGRAHAQFATDPLVTAEQFVVGGPYTVRGYPQGELLGDSAYVLSSEFRWTPYQEDPEKLEFLTFIDHGQSSLQQPQAGELSSQDLTGAGVGVRFRLGDSTQARLDLGFPISPSTNSRRNSPVVYAGIQTRLW